MKLAQIALSKRLAYILHLGLVEIRKLASSGNPQQIADLADALETLPRFLENSRDEDLELIRFVLRGYQEKYPQSSFNYLSYVEDEEVPAKF